MATEQIPVPSRERQKGSKPLIVGGGWIIGMTMFPSAGQPPSWRSWVRQNDAQKNRTTTWGASSK